MSKYLVSIRYYCSFYYKYKCYVGARYRALSRKTNDCYKLILSQNNSKYIQKRDHHIKIMALLVLHHKRLLLVTFILLCFLSVTVRGKNHTYIYICVCVCVCVFIFSLISNYIYEYPTIYIIMVFYIYLICR